MPTAAESKKTFLQPSSGSWRQETTSYHQSPCSCPSCCRKALALCSTDPIPNSALNYIFLIVPRISGALAFPLLECFSPLVAICLAHVLASHSYLSITFSATPFKTVTLPHLTCPTLLSCLTFLLALTIIQYIMFLFSLLVFYCFFSPTISTL